MPARITKGAKSMIIRSSEKGQALIVIAFAAIVLFSFAALAIDGSRVFSDKRHAQNAADTAVLAGALAYARGNSVDTAAQTRATSNGYNDILPSNDVTITVVDAPSGICPANTLGKDITVNIVSHVNTTFARVIGRTQMTNVVTATSRACGSYTGPTFNGNAIVSLAPSGVGYDGSGTPDWNITGGGIFSNSTSSTAATCSGSAGITVPSVSVVVNGNTDFACASVNIGSITRDTSQYSYADVASLFPTPPACNGTATYSGGQWHPDTRAGIDGSLATFTDHHNPVFASGLYCITDSPGPYQDTISGSEVTFYMMDPNLVLKFSGGGSLAASAPTGGDYKGILLYLAPQIDGNGNLLRTQELALQGNGNGNTTGTIYAPSAKVVMFGNSGTGAYDCQVIAYTVESGGNADITIAYHANNNYVAALPITLTLLQ
jgi:Flp pilus assembly protein TadG